MVVVVHASFDRRPGPPLADFGIRIGIISGLHPVRVVVDERREVGRGKKERIEEAKGPQQHACPRSALGTDTHIIHKTGDGKCGTVAVWKSTSTKRACTR